MRSSLAALIIYIALTVFSIESQSAVGASRSHAFEDYTDSWVITVGGGYTTRFVKHRETSTDTSFTAINEDIHVVDIPLTIAVMKELFNQSRFSVTLKFFGGINDGDYKSDYDPANSDSKNKSVFEEKLSGVHFGGGASLNYNSFLYGYKIQPYVGLDLFQDQGELSLTHNSGSAVTTHTYKDQVVLIGLGVRVFDSEVGLMSYFMASLPQALNESISVQTANGGAISTGTMVPAEITRAPLQFSLGFGFVF